MRSFSVLLIGLVLACDDGGPSLDASGPDAPSAPDAQAPDAQAPDAQAPDAQAPDAQAADAGATGVSTWNGADGLPDVACPAWTLVDSASPEEPSLAAGVLTVSTDLDAEAMGYLQQDAELITPSMRIIEGTVRYIGGSASVADRAPAIMGFRTDTDLKKNILMIAEGEIFLLSGESLKGPSVAVATSDAPHTYRVEVDTGSGAIVVFRDGVQVLTGNTFPEPNGGTIAVFWGELSINAHGTSAWTSVTHNAHSPTFCR
jgi:hypothetical protein